MVYKVLKAQIGQNIEVYVDDMTTKSKEAQNRAIDLQENILTLRANIMLPNPKNVDSAS